MNKRNRIKLFQQHAVHKHYNLGLDSIEILMKAEDIFGITIPDREA